MVNALIRLRLALKTNANSMQIFQYFFDNFFVFRQWPLIFYISNINTGLYRFLLKFFNFGIYTSLPFLVSIYWQFNEQIYSFNPCDSKMLVIALKLKVVVIKISLYLHKIKLNTFVETTTVLVHTQCTLNKQKIRAYFKHAL